MNTIEPSIEKASKKRSFSRRLLSFLLLWFYRAFGTAVLLVALIVVIAQTDIAKGWMKDGILALVNSQLKGRVECSDVELDIFRGFVLVNPTLLADNTTVLTADEISISYTLSALTQKIISIDQLEIVKPIIYLQKSKSSGNWNFTQIVKPVNDSTTTEPLSGVLTIRELRIVGGVITVKDETKEVFGTNSFQPSNVYLHDVNLSASVRMNLKDNDMSFMMNDFSCVDDNDKLTVNRMSTIVRASKLGVDVQSLHIVTPRSDIRASIRLLDVDVFRGLSDSLLQAHPITANIQADKVWGPDLHYFIPEVNLLDGYSLVCKARFDGKSIRVDDMELHGGQNVVYGSVLVTSVDDDSKLGLDIRIDRASARYADVRRRIAFVQLPELPFLTTTRLDSVHMRGHPNDSLWFALKGEDAPGRFDGKMTLYLNEKRLGYKVDMKVEKGELGVFDSDSSVSSQLNAHVVMNGWGTDPKDLEGEATITMGPSSLFKRNIRSAMLQITANGKGQISFDTVYANLTKVGIDTLDSFLQAEQWTSGRGIIDVGSGHDTKLSGSVSCYGLDLAELLKVEELPSRLSGSFDFDVTGLQPDSILGALDARVSQLVLADRAMLPFTMKVTSERSGLNRILALASEFGDVTLSGSFTPSRLLNNLDALVRRVGAQVDMRTRYLNTSNSSAGAAVAPLDPFDITIVADVKDITPVNMFVPDVRLSAAFQLRSFIRATSSHLEIKIDTLITQSLAMLSGNTNVFADPVSASGHLRFRTDGISEPINLILSGRCDSTITINELVIHAPRVQLSELNGGLQLSAQTHVNEHWFYVKGSGQFDAYQASLRVDTAHVVVDTTRGLEWMSLKPGTISVSSGKFVADGISFQRPQAESVFIDGMFSQNDFNGATVRVENLTLNRIPDFISLDPDHPLLLVDGLVNSCTVVANGTWSDPQFDLDLKAQKVSYNDQLIGNLNASFKHRNAVVSGQAWLAEGRDSTANNALDLVVRTFPVNLSLDSVTDRIADKQPVDIELNARKLSLAAIEPFLPAVENVYGVADASIIVKGTTPKDIKLSGNGVVKNAAFTASSTNIRYNAGGKLHLDGETLYVDSLTVANVEKDLKGGRALASGAIVFKGLSVDSIDLSVVTQTRQGVRVMNMASQTRSPDIYGDLIIRSGSNPIRLFGKLDSPTLEGDLVVLYSDIIFPKERSTTRARNTSFEYVRRSDTVRRQRNFVDYAANFSNTAKLEVDTTDYSAIATAIRTLIKANSSSFIDLLQYDLNIYIQGRTLLTMIFGPFEILTADLEQVDTKLPLHFSGRFGNSSTKLRGKVRVKEGASTYKFYKPFSTSGILTFDAGGMTNPGLDLKAVYLDTRFINGEREEYKVELAITGTKKSPQITYRLWRKNREVIGDSAKIAGDALMLILVGRTQDELTESGQGNLVNEVNASFSAVATSALGDMISGNGVIQNAQVDIAADPSQSRLTLVGQVFGNVSYRVSGQISDFSGNSTFTVTVPLSVLNDADALKYFIMDFSRSLTESGNITRQTRDWEIKIGARLP